MLRIIVFDEEDKLKFEEDRDIHFDIYRVFTDSVMQKESLPEIDYQSLLDICPIEQIPEELNFFDFPIPSPFPSSLNQGESVLHNSYLKTPERTSSLESLIGKVSDNSEDTIPYALNTVSEDAQGCSNAQGCSKSDDTHISIPDQPETVNHTVDHTIRRSDDIRERTTNQSDVLEDSTLNFVLEEPTSHKSKTAVSSPPINQFEIQR